MQLKNANEEVKEDKKKPIVECTKTNEMMGNMRESSQPTQSQIMSGTIRTITEEMMKLMQDLSSELQNRDESLEKDSIASGYWWYIYRSAVYLQQLINDTTAVHKSTLLFREQANRSYNEPKVNISLT